MRIYMQSPIIGEQAGRFCHLILQPDLLQGWWVMVESGQQGGVSRVKRSYYEQHEAAVAAFEALRNVQIGKGLRIMFVQGQEQEGVRR